MCKILDKFDTFSLNYSNLLRVPLFPDIVYSAARKSLPHSEFTVINAYTCMTVSEVCEIRDIRLFELVNVIYQ